jgi:cytochrome c biogenesis protein CcmG/thiol:disulfide interchange protein DsbE
MKRLLYILPVGAFLALAFVLFRGLLAPPPGELPSMLIGKPAPHLQLPALMASVPSFGAKDLADGHVTVLNFWASWCVPCHEDAPALAALSTFKGFRLYGLAYKDTPAKARAFLADTGNPFRRIALDQSGRAGIEWGIYGVPETFVIDGHGIIRARIVGPLTEDAVQNKLLPAIRAAQAGS